MNYSIKLGQMGEQAVASLYAKNSFVIVARNFVNKFGKRLGEIDIIAIKNGHLHFVEVKSRSSEKFGSIKETVTAFKKQRFVKTINIFLCANPRFYGCPLHIDVAFVEFSRIDKRIRKITIQSDCCDVDY